MVSFEQLFSFCIVIISLIGLIVRVMSKKK